MSTGLVQEVPHEGNNKDIFNSGVKAGIGHVANQQATQQAMQQGQVSAYHKGASDIAGAVNEKLAGLGQQQPQGQEQQVVTQVAQMMQAAQGGDKGAEQQLAGIVQAAQSGDQQASAVLEAAQAMLQQAG